jgi:hypothetical protein
MEVQNRKEISFLVFGGFIALFLLFLFLSPRGSAKGAFTFEGVVGSTEIGGFPIVTLVIVFVILIIVLIAVILLLKKFRRKKHSFIAPKPEPSLDLGVPKSFEPLMENVGPKIKSKGQTENQVANIGDEDIENLFSENVGFNRDDTVIKESKDNFPEPSLDEKSDILTSPVEPLIKEKISGPNMVNMNQLKTQINSLFNKGYKRDQIMNFLDKKGFTSDQILGVVEEINKENLKNYINSATKQGFSKEQIVRNLLSHGWKQEQISKFMK